MTGTGQVHVRRSRAAAPGGRLTPGSALRCLRVGEVSGLLWSDLDLERGFVTVPRTVEEDEDGSLLEYPPKNGKARVVPLPPLACEKLRAFPAGAARVPARPGRRLERGRPRGAEEKRDADGALVAEEPVVELGGAAED